MKNNSKKRKVRGSKIRNSRSEKEKQKHKKRFKKLEKTADEETIESGNHSQLSSKVSQDFPFVETDEIKNLKSRVKRWIKVDRPVHVIGPTGCGKTALSLKIAEERDRPVVWINGDAELDTSDLVGEYAEEKRYSERDKYIHNVMKSKEIIRDRWVDNPLTIAAKEGATLIYNEFSRTKPIANNVLLSVFEEGILELPGQRGESRYIDVHPEFRAILTSNSSEYAGIHKPQDALLDRLAGIYMDFYNKKTEKEILKSHLNSKNIKSDIPEELIEDIVTIIREMREKLDVDIGTRSQIMAIEGLTTIDNINKKTSTEVFVDVLSSKIAHYNDIDELKKQIQKTTENKATYL